MNPSDAEAGTEPQIKVAPNGPYLVRGGVPLRTAGGESIETREVYALCRCGRSAKKPFCDGTHAKAGFSAEDTADRGPISARRVAYKGKEITVHDDRSICAHVGICTDELPNVFVHGGDPWCVPEAEEDVRKIIDIVKRCPSGAITYALGDSTEAVEEDEGPAITVLKDGPLAVAGRPRLQSADSDAYESRARYTLCRCGGSGNKPFCDGSHWSIGFQDG